MTSSESTIISTNYWRVPSVEGAFSGILEGCPSDERRKEIIAEAEAERAAWKPNAEALLLLDQMKQFVGSRVCIQFWDSCMWLLEEEGPFPCDADCLGVTVLEDGEFPQAFLLLENVVEIPNFDGYSPKSYFINRECCNYLHAPLADIYSVKKVVTP